MFTSGKLFVALIAAAVIGVTGSPVELEKRLTAFNFTLCIASPSGFGEICTNATMDHGGCGLLKDELDKAVIFIDTGDTDCFLSTYVWVSLPSCFPVPFWSRLSDSSSSRLRCSDYSCGADDGVTQEVQGPTDLVAINFAQMASSLGCL
jgi:hypothetical protein